LHAWLHKIAKATALSKESVPAKSDPPCALELVELTRYCEDGRLEVDNNAAARGVSASPIIPSIKSKISDPGTSSQKCSSYASQPDQAVNAASRTVTANALMCRIDF
jgi:hypothetical protein